jgi:hypothetical protein
VLAITIFSLSMGAFLGATFIEGETGSGDDEHIALGRTRQDLEE